MFSAFSARRTLAALAVAVVACAAGIPAPDRAPQPDSAFVEVPYPPPPARVEKLPIRPRGDARWIDGQWRWEGERWTWSPGAWVLPPPGARFAEWTLRREPDGTLRAARPSWRDAEGRELPPPPVLAVAVGEAARDAVPPRCP